MNPRIIKVTQDIEKTKAKIIELQTLLPQLENKKMNLENEEIIRRVRKASASARLGDLESVLEAIREPESSSKAEVFVANESAHDKFISIDSSRYDTQEPIEDSLKD